MCEWPTIVNEDGSTYPPKPHGHDHDDPGHDCSDVVGTVSRRTMLQTAAGTLGAIAGIKLLNPLAAHAAGSASQFGVVMQPATAARNWKGMNVVLLGTAGGPVPHSGRGPSSNAIIVDGNTYMLDCGVGTIRQLVDAGIPYRSLRALFISHLHSDHVGDYYPTIVAGRPISGQPGFSKYGIDVYGPGPAPFILPPPEVPPVNLPHPTPGTTHMNRAVLDAYAYSVNVMYIKSNTGPDIRELVRAHDIKIPLRREIRKSDLHPGADLFTNFQPFKIYEDQHVKVTATLALHLPVIPAFGLRFDTEYGSVTFSGDGLPIPNITTLAKGSDLLVHEIMYAQAMLDHGVSEEFVRELRITHTDVTQVGQVASGADVGGLALSHVIGVDPLVTWGPDLPQAQWIKPIRPNYAGPIRLGQDLMRFKIG